MLKIHSSLLYMGIITDILTSILLFMAYLSVYFYKLSNYIFRIFCIPINLKSIRKADKSKLSCAILIKIYREVPGVLIHENGYILSIPFRHSGAIAGFIRCIQSHTLAVEKTIVNEVAHFTPDR